MDDLRAPGVLDSPDALVRLVRAGDERAFARIVRLHRSAMVRAALVVTLDLDLAAEAVAAAWPIAWRRIDELDDPARVGPWLCGIAAREAREIAVHGSGRFDLGTPQDPETALPSGPPPAVPQSADRSVDPGLLAVLAGLPPDDRVLAALAHLGGLTPAEIGRAIGTPPAQVIRRSGDLALAVARQMGIGGAAGERAELALADRLHAFADVPIGHVDIDAVARVAKLTRNDRRNRLMSLAIAATVAAVVVIVPLLGNSGAPPAWADGAALPWLVPSPSVEDRPDNPALESDRGASRP